MLADAGSPDDTKWPKPVPPVEPESVDDELSAPPLFIDAARSDNSSLSSRFDRACSSIVAAAAIILDPLGAVLDVEGLLVVKCNVEAAESEDAMFKEMKGEIIGSALYG